MHAIWLLLTALLTTAAAPAPPPISPKCQAELNAYGNDDKLNGPHCIDPTTKWCELLPGRRALATQWGSRPAPAPLAVCD